MRFRSYFNHALHIIDGYDGKMPLAQLLKQYFARNRKHGSTDRKMIAHACYSYYRIGHAWKDRPPEIRLKAALLLCSEDPAKWSEVLDGETPPSFPVEDIFPWKDELSEGIDHHSFCRSFLRQPDLFLRIRPGQEKEVLQKFSELQTRQPLPDGYEIIPPFTLRLPNGSKIEEFFTPDKEIVVQDYSSQRLAPFLQLPDDQPSTAKRAVWDACAASGGKSILAHDLNPGIELTVSDIRTSILHNLAQRFRTAGIGHYHSFEADLTATGLIAAGLDTDQLTPHSLAPHPPPHSPSLPPFDLILADVPCTGSGTWSRTPEELFFFDPAKIDVYRDRQEKILSTLVPHLGKKAALVYSTCSVFKKENEGMVKFIEDSLGLPPERMETIKGYDDRADSMFAARFIS
jgi:16S rRNA (cytosine967-C5)-methyltransferase